MPYVNHRWLGGMLTNYKTVRQSIKRLKDLEVMRDSKKFAGFTKKEALHFTRELDKLERNLGGIKDMKGLPDAIFVIDVGYENIAVSEAVKLRIPIVGVVDTNRNPDNINYIIPGNDDAIRSVRFYTKNIVDSIVETRASLKEINKENEEDKVKVVKKEADGKEADVRHIIIKKDDKGKIIKTDIEEDVKSDGNMED